MTESADVISARGLEVRYGDTIAVAGIDIQVAAGEVLGVIGPDGAGKTSTLRVLAGLHRACAGVVTAFGEPIWKSRRRLHHRLGFLAQRFALYGDLTVDENIQFFSLLLGVRQWRERRLMLLERVGLGAFHDRQADRLSGGMKQKLALVCSLLHSPEILILDEPTTGVDPVTRREFWRLLADLVADGLTLVVATPYLDEAERCSRVVLMHRGRILADAHPATLPALLPGRMIEISAGPRPLVLATLRLTPGVLDVRAVASLFHARCAEGGPTPTDLRTTLIAAGAKVEDAREIPSNLEDTFLHLTRATAPAATEAA